jgi:hypothetical protein
MTLPTITKTKAEAIKLAADLFPTADKAIAALPPDTQLPRYTLNSRTSDTLREVLFWIHEQRPKIYKRARWHLFYDMARRVVEQIDENAQAKVRELYTQSDHRSFVARLEKTEAAETVTGNGQGI